MAYRWILSPLTLFTIPYEDGTGADIFQDAKFSQYIDPGTGKRYPHSNAASLDTRVLSLVRGTQWTPIDNDNQCINVLQRDYVTTTEILATTPQADGWTNQRFNQFINRVQQAGFTTTGLTRTTTFLVILNTIGRQINPNFDAAGENA